MDHRASRAQRQTDRLLARPSPRTGG